MVLIARALELVWHSLPRGGGLQHEVNVNLRAVPVPLSLLPAGELRSHIPTPITPFIGSSVSAHRHHAAPEKPRCTGNSQIFCQLAIFS
jgi:hypothetical protein